jgi:outer membrane protein OmpA-like peptidoglycan-associated protein
VIVAFSAMARRSWVLLGALALWAVLLGAASFRSAGCNGGVVLAVMQRAEEIFARDGNAEALSRALAAAKAPPKRALDDALADEIRCGETIYLSGDLLFRKDEYRLRPNAEPILRKVKRVLARSPEATVTLAGHADSSGEVAHNQMLSERRAEFVAAWLLRNGAVQRAKLTARGHGESQPLVDESMAPPELNRRVELTIRCPTAEVGL